MIPKFMDGYHKAPLFITGLPRSRTAWLSNLFTRSGRLVHHELQRKFDTAADYVAFMQELVTACPYGVGDSSSLLPMIGAEVVAAFPSASWVFVERAPKDALEAAIAACDPGLESFIRRAWPKLQHDLADLADSIPARQRFHISWHELNRERRAQELYSWATGDHLPAHVYIHLNGLNITIPKFSAPDLAWMSDSLPPPKRVEILPAPLPHQENLTARLVTAEDMGTFDTWAKQHGTCYAVDRSPPFGVVIDIDGEPAAALFAHLAVDRPVAWLEDPLTKPGLGMADALRLLSFGVGAVRAGLCSMGYDVLIANTTAPIARVLAGWGWTVREHGLTKLEITTA